MRRIVLISLAFAAGAAFAASADLASAQALGPLLPKSKAQIGAQVSWAHRDLGGDPPAYELDQHTFSIPARYGITEFATLSAQVMVTDQALHSPDRDMRYYLVGAGLQALVWRNDDYLISGGIDYNETFFVDQTGSARDERHWNFTVIVEIQRSFSWRQAAFTLWGGPLFSEYVVVWEQGTAGSGSRLDAVGTGVAFGINAVLFGHYEAYYNFTLVDHYQPHVGVSYQF